MESWPKEQEHSASPEALKYESHEESGEHKKIERHRGGNGDGGMGGEVMKANCAHSEPLTTGKTKQGVRSHGDSGS